MGNTLLKTLSSPVSSRSLGSRSICRNRSYDFFWTSIRFGIGIDVLIFEKSTRSRVAPFSGVCIVQILYHQTAHNGPCCALAPSGEPKACGSLRIKIKMPEGINTLRAGSVHAGQSLAVVLTNCRADRGVRNSLCQEPGSLSGNQIIAGGVRLRQTPPAGQW